MVVFLFASSLFALGKKEEPDERPINNGEWALSITSFDVSSLPLSRQVIGNVIQRELVNSLNAVDHRIRISPEYAWYEGYAWSQTRSTAAKALAAKRDERDQLLFRGESDWRYRKNLKTIDGDIKKLEEALRKAVEQEPLVAKEPAFVLSGGNNEGAFPNPPAAGAEYQFCKKEKVDAFLAGSVSEYHERIYVSLRLYTLYTNSFVYEDSLIFSTEDTTIAVNEISGRLQEAVSGGKAAEIAVHTENADAMVLINRSFIGRGEIPRRDYPPGKVTVEVFAENYEPAQAETELKSGEFTEITATLRPLNRIPMNINVPGKSGVSVYRGALYAGEAPLTLQLPANQLEYVFAETPEGRTSKAVFLVNEPIPPMGSPRGTDPKSSLFLNLFPKKSTLEAGNTLQLQTRIPPPPGEDRVLKARRRYYRSWGGTWITGIAAWMLYGYSTTYTDTYNRNPISLDMYNDARRLQVASMCGIGLVSVAVLVEIIQMARYIHVADDDSPPLVK
ncbi:hypothetical protein AGMMS50268_24800 [Spirochaetia bacterium]|nr:hypothetical protein AGMMS50268_24800 [Spirochaetia bacterium]